MANPLPKTTYIGTIGELFVQLRLLEYDIQAAPPIKDSGNDLIAIKGEVVKFVQVKTSINHIPRLDNLPGIYHIVMLVELKYDEHGALLFDQSKIFAVKKDEKRDSKQELTRKVANALWSE